MRRVLVGLVIVASAAVGCAPEEQAASPGATGSPASEACAKESLPLKNPGRLTVGTGNPAYPPWWEGGETDEHPEWELNDPYLLQGFEGAVVGALAEELGFGLDEIEFVPVPFNKSFAPGPKDFDFVLQQISYKDKRAEAVDFSDSYYDVNQALVSVEGSPIAGATTVEDLKDATLGAPIGTTSLDYIEQTIQPNVEPRVYDDLTGAIQDLKSGAIDGIVVDLPTAFFITAVQIKNGVIVGQFPSVGQQEYFALAFEKGSGLVECVNQALDRLKADGTLAAIQQEWLADKASAPVIEV
ncbi:MAG: amino acid ABC transporter substrate-binding protein [Actinomycetota bacterium]|jgi:polar amino acid transport system substrate-binding protein|nr:MAG: amino acid ABC transporter substrate-binding protein [Actinomycetota bacterium]